MRRECRERFPRHHGLAIPTCIMAHAWRTHRDACRDNWIAAPVEAVGRENVPGIPGVCVTCNITYLVRVPLANRVIKNTNHWGLANNTLQQQWLVQCAASSQWNQSFRMHKYSKSKTHKSMALWSSIITHNGVWLSGSSPSTIAITHWGRVTHICVSKLTIIGSDNGLSPERRQANFWTNAGILLIGTLGTNFSEILVGIQSFSFKKMQLKMSSAKWRQFVSASMC